jgi:hypothetical protein
VICRALALAVALLSGCGAPEVIVPTLDGPPMMSDLARPPDAAEAYVDLSIAPPSDGAASDGAASDGAPGGSLCPNGLLFCEGFESGLNGTIWSTTAQNTMVTLDPGRAYRGTHSLHVYLDAATPAQGDAVMNGWVAEKKSFVGAQPVLAMRFFLYLPANPPTQHTIFLRALGANGYFDFSQVNDHLWGGAYGNGNGDQGTAGPAIPTDQWVCMEWQLTNMGAHEDVVLYMNGAQALHLTNYGGVPINSLAVTNLYVGAAYHSSGQTIPAHDIWIDELAVDTQRIGCTR